MKKTLMCYLAPTIFLAMVNANAGIVPYISLSGEEQATAKFDLNKDSYVTEGEVEEELREEAIDKSVKLQKQGISASATAAVIKDMEKHVQTDAEVIIHKLDKDGDQLVEPDEVKHR